MKKVLAYCTFTVLLVITGFMTSCGGDDSSLNRNWGIMIDHVEISETKSGGESWDIDGLPDIFVIIKKNGVEIFRTPVAKDTTSVTWGKWVPVHT